MAKVSFVTKSGEHVSFKTGGKKKKGSKAKRKPSAYNKFVSRRMKHYIGKGYSATRAMKAIAKEWNAQK